MHTSSPDSERPSLGVTVFVIIVPAILWIAVLAELMFFVPIFDRIFADFHLGLPLASEWTIACSHWCIKYPYVLPMPLAMIVVAIAGSIWLIRHQLGKRLLGGVWCAAMMLLPIVVGLLIAVVCYLPYVKLLEGLAGQKG
jgi:type II secretory pathway component PulF